MAQQLTAEEKTAFLQQLKERFHDHSDRHPDWTWSEVEAGLKANEGAFEAIYQMEKSGGEPDLISPWPESEGLVYVDFSAASPPGRQKLCYDDAALASRKKNKPAGSALALAEQMGVQLLNEDQYMALQRVEVVDEKSSSWLLTPEDVRQQGGALFGDYRYGRPFIYHNGAESYFTGRSFRAYVTL